ncbi:MAG: CocE/NonD family hydrolase [Pseudomonadota bacterium]
MFQRLLQRCALGLALAMGVGAALDDALARDQAADRSCLGPVPCVLDNRSYHVLEPEGWDGKTPLPVLLHFHGWGRQGTLIVKHSRIAGATKERGVLLVAPNGQGLTWRFRTANSPDVAFADAVIADIARRWPIDRAQIFVSGYSYGGAMAWRYACHSKTRLKAVFAVSGTASLRGDGCVRPVTLHHVHGTRDTVLPYPFGPGGAVEGAVAYWRAHNRCAETVSKKEIWKAVPILTFTRHVWRDCASGFDVVLDVHPRGHFIPRFWIARQLDDYGLSAR